MREVLAGWTERRTMVKASTALVIEAVAAIYFVADGIDDAIEELRGHWNFALIMEFVVALALLIAIGVSARQLRRIIDESRQNREALDIARGAFGDIVTARFAQWGLSRAESDVALFAIKGCTIGEIATMRNAAEGTVRSQLSQVYAKAGVTNRTMLLSQFVEDLL